MSLIRRALAGAALVLIVGVGLAPDAGSAPRVSDQTAYGLTGGNHLIRFRTATPGNVDRNVAISGLQAGEKILGIDFRPATGELVGLGSASRLYTINVSTGAATLESALSTPLVGSAFDIDFNPTVDRLRIVSNAQQNLRVNVDTGAATVDMPLAFGGMDANSGADPTIVGAAYTNSQCGGPNPQPDGTPARTTALFDIDAGLDVLATQNPPNDGTLNTVGELGFDTTGRVGFDISPNNNQAFSTYIRTGFKAAALYTVDLLTGASYRVGAIGGTNRDVVDVALRFQLPCAPVVM